MGSELEVRLQARRRHALPWGGGRPDPGTHQRQRSNMRKGLLCSLAFLVGPIVAQPSLALAQQPGYYPAWPSASAGAVQGYGYYQPPSANSGYNYQYPQA